MLACGTQRCRCSTVAFSAKRTCTGVGLRPPRSWMTRSGHWGNWGHPSNKRGLLFLAAREREFTECIARSSIRNRKRLFHRNLLRADKSLFGVGAKLGFADLARLRHREGVDEDHMARDLEARDLTAAAGDHLVDVDGGAGRGLDIGHRDLAEGLIRHPPTAT